MYDVIERDVMLTLRSHTVYEFMFTNYTIDIFYCFGSTSNFFTRIIQNKVFGYSIKLKVVLVFACSQTEREK